MDTITDILARPDEAARQIEQLSAAVRALTAQLAAVTAEKDAAIVLADARGVGRDIQMRRFERLLAERNMFKSTCLQMDARDLQRAAAARKVAQYARAATADNDERYNACQRDFFRAIEQRDAARAEVARVTELAITERDSAAREIERLTAALDEMNAWMNEAEDIAMPSDKDFYRTLHDMVLAALRGDTAPARSLCGCGHYHGDHSLSDDGGRRVCMHLGCDCIIDTAPATGRE